MVCSRCFPLDVTRKWRYEDVIPKIHSKWIVWESVFIKHWIKGQDSNKRVLLWVTCQWFIGLKISHTEPVHQTRSWSPPPWTLVTHWENWQGQPFSKPNWVVGKLKLNYICSKGVWCRMELKAEREWSNKKQCDKQNDRKTSTMSFSPSCQT